VKFTVRGASTLWFLVNTSRPLEVPSNEAVGLLAATVTDGSEALASATKKFPAKLAVRRQSTRRAARQVAIGVFIKRPIVPGGKKPG
jgi:hypothetical protein